MQLNRRLLTKYFLLGRYGIAVSRLSLGIMAFGSEWGVSRKKGARQLFNSYIAPSFPYSFFTPGMQAMLTGGAAVGDKPASYGAPKLIDARPAGVE